MNEVLPSKDIFFLTDDLVNRSDAYW